LKALVSEKELIHKKRRRSYWKQ